VGVGGRHEHRVHPTRLELLGFAPEWRRSSEIGSTVSVPTSVLDLLRRTGRAHVSLRARLVRLHGRGRLVSGRRDRSRLPGVRAARVSAAPRRRIRVAPSRCSTHCSKSAPPKPAGSCSKVSARGRRGGHARDDRGDARRSLTVDEQLRRRTEPAARVHVGVAKRAATSAAEPTSNRRDRAHVGRTRPTHGPWPCAIENATTARPRGRTLRAWSPPPAVTTRSATASSGPSPSGACTASTRRSSVPHHAPRAHDLADMRSGERIGDGARHPRAVPVGVGTARSDENALRQLPGRVSTGSAPLTPGSTSALLARPRRPRRRSECTLGVCHRGRGR